MLYCLVTQYDVVISTFGNLPRRTEGIFILAMIASYRAGVRLAPLSLSHWSAFILVMLLQEVVQLLLFTSFGEVNIGLGIFLFYFLWATI